MKKTTVALSSIISVLIFAGCSRKAENTSLKISDCAVPNAQLAIVVDWQNLRKSELGKKWNIDNISTDGTPLSLKEEIQEALGIRSQDIIASVLTANFADVNLAGLQADLLSLQKNGASRPPLQLSDSLFAMKTVLSKPLNAKHLERTLQNQANDFGIALRTFDRNGALIFVLDNPSGKGFAAALTDNSHTVYLASDESILIYVLDKIAAQSKDIAQLMEIDSEIPETSQFRVALLTNPSNPQKEQDQQSAATPQQAALARSFFASFESMRNAGCGITISSHITFSARFKLGDKEDAVKACNVLQAGLVPALMLSIMMQGGNVPPDMYDRIICTQDGRYVNIAARLEESEIQALISASAQAVAKQSGK